MLRELVFFRHGQTDWNKEERIQGSTDIPLNSRGVEEAHALARRLETQKLQVVVSSRLQRAHKTAQIVCSHLNIPCFVIDGLEEAGFGEGEGFTRSELVERLGQEMWDHWKGTHPDSFEIRFGDGETKREVQNRAFRALEEFLHEQHFERVGVSTHGALLSYCAHRLLPEHHPSLYVRNCATFGFRYNLAERRWQYYGEIPAGEPGAS